MKMFFAVSVGLFAAACGHIAIVKGAPRLDSYVAQISFTWAAIAYNNRKGNRP